MCVFFNIYVVGGSFINYLCINIYIYIECMKKKITLEAKFGVVEFSQVVLG